MSHTNNLLHRLLEEEVVYTWQGLGVAIKQWKTEVCGALESTR